MLIRVGHEFIFDAPSTVPMLLKLYLHPSQLSKIQKPERLRIEPETPVEEFLDGFGNRVGRLVLPAGKVRISNEAVLIDNGQPDVINDSAQQHPVEKLPVDVLPYLLSSRYCEVDRLSEVAEFLFKEIPAGWARVQAVCDWIHDNVRFGYEFARSTKTAYEVYIERTGVCRDFAHLAVTFCRCLNIPARYAAGYLGYIGIPPQPAPMDFSSWFEVYLGHEWYTFDARHNVPRVGRVLMVRGRDAVDTALTTSFEPLNLVEFNVWATELKEM